MSVWSLWLPILCSGLATHIASTLAWVVLPHHKPEWTKLPDEDGLLDWLNSRSTPAGQYIFPFHLGEDGKPSAEQEQKARDGCRGMLVLWPEPPNMGVNIGLTLAFFMVAAFTIGYLASLALAPGASFMDVLQLVGTAGLLTHCAAKFPNVFWFRRKVAMDLVDGVAYALITGVIFAVMWPGASA